MKRSNLERLLQLSADLSDAMIAMGRSDEQAWKLALVLHRALRGSSLERQESIRLSVYNAIWDVVSRCCKCRKMVPLEDCAVDVHNRTWCIACMEAEDGAVSDRQDWEISRG